MAWFTRTNWSDGDQPNGDDFSAPGKDLRTWGGPVDAANNPLNNLSLMRLNPAALPSVPSAGSFVYDNAASNLKFYDGSAWSVVGGVNPAPHWFVASGTPGSGVGVSGDLYLNSASGDLYGPKTGGGWGSAAMNLKGPTGSQGIQGIQGVQGNAGNTGATGYSPVYIVAAGAPAGGTGNNGDMYVNSTTSDVYGPKTGGAWGAIVCNIKGAQGIQGIQGNTGNTGSTGYAPLYIVAAGAPAGGTGNNGDMYINSTTSDVYGPKAGGAWGSIVCNIKGATGSTGAQGTNVVWLSGAGAPAGGTGNNGDMYFNSTTGDVYGPKASGAWGAIQKNLVGPPGSGMTDPGSNGIMKRTSLNTSAVATAADLEAALTFTDITTGNVSTGAHGHMPKLPNDSTKFLNGVGSWVAVNVFNPSILVQANGFAYVLLMGASDDYYYPYFSMTRQRGTLASPQPIQVGDTCGAINVYGRSPAGADYGVASFSATIAGWNGNFIKGQFNFNVSNGANAGANTSCFSTNSDATTFYTAINTLQGALLFSADNSWDIGAAGATRPRNVYVAGAGTFGGTLTANQFTGSGAGLGTGTVPIASLVTGDYSAKITSGTYSISVSGNQAIADIVYVIDGGGSVPATGIKGDLIVDFNCTVTGWALLADQTGSAVVNIWKVAYASYPANSGNKITASAPPTISSATKGQSSTLTGWTTAISAGDCLRINLDSVTTCTRVVLILKVTRT